MQVPLPYKPKRLVNPKGITHKNQLHCQFTTIYCTCQERKNTTECNNAKVCLCSQFGKEKTVIL